MQRYQIMVPGFRWDGRDMAIGDSIEADDTTEIRANLALGRLVLATTSIAHAVPPPAQPADPQDEPVEIPAFLARAPEPRQKRKYVRRDTAAK